MAFVTTRHELAWTATGGRRGAGHRVPRRAPGHPADADGQARGDEPPRRRLAAGASPTDPVLLVRFSALTYNGHRIHYDTPYAPA